LTGNLKKKDLAAQTQKHVLSLIVRIDRWGSKSLDDYDKIPFKIEYPRLNNEKTEVLTPEQFKRLIDVIEAYPDIQVRNFVKMVLHTGMRRGELFKLRWEHVNFDTGFILIKDPKGMIDQKIPMNEAAKELLQNHPRPFPDSSFVFPGRGGKQRVCINKRVNEIKTLAGLPKDFRPLHGLRHVFASMLASSGQVDMYTLQRLLTHKSPAMTQRYAHLADERLMAAANVTNDLISEIQQVTGTKEKIENE
jgi:integrase